MTALQIVGVIAAAGCWAFAGYSIRKGRMPGLFGESDRTRRPELFWWDVASYVGGGALFLYFALAM